MTAREVVADLLVVAGASATTAGAWIIYSPSAYIVGGLWCVVIAFALANAGPSR